MPLACQNASVVHRINSISHLRYTSMSRNHAVLLFAFACLGTAQSAFAQTDPALAAPAETPAKPAIADPEKKPLQFGVTARVSTLGLGVEVGTQINDFVALRLGYNGFSYNRTQTYQAVDYDAKLKMSSVAALADFYPGKRTGLHLTAGFLFNNNKVEATGKPSSSGEAQTYQFNGVTYSASDVGSLNGSLAFNKTSPYLGFGFTRPYGGESGLKIVTEFGVVFQGKPHLSLDRSGGIANAQLDTDLAAQRDKTQSDVNKFQYYPVAAIGIAYTF